VYDATSPGVVTVVCNSIVVDVPIDTPESICYLRNLDSGATYFAYNFPYLQSSYNAGAFVIDRTSRLQLCMSVEINYSLYGPTRCVNVT
jgi:hypothetical protein